MVICQKNICMHTSKVIGRLLLLLLLHIWPKEVPEIICLFHISMHHSESVTKCGHWFQYVPHSNESGITFLKGHQV